jgi:hypothetical protein
MSEPPIIDRLLGPEHPELGCDECFDNIDRYVETELGGPFGPCAACVSPAECRHDRHCLGMRAHLLGCPTCAEEYASLKALLEGPGGAPA